MTELEALIARDINRGAAKRLGLDFIPEDGIVIRSA